MPKRPSPASLSDEESVEVATLTPSWVPRGKESAGGGGMWGGSFGSRYEMGGALRGRPPSERGGGVGVGGH